MDVVAILHPMVDASERGSGIRNRTDPDIVALKGFDKGFGHAVAFGALHRRETWDEIERQCGLVVLWAVKIEPLSESHCSACGARILPNRLSTQDHHVAEHLTGDAGARLSPRRSLAVMTIEREDDAHDLAIPSGELEHIQAPAAIRADRGDLAVMLARSPASGMAFKQQTVLLHQPINALGVNRSLTCGSPLALE